MGLITLITGNKAGRKLNPVQTQHRSELLWSASHLLNPAQSAMGLNKNQCLATPLLPLCCVPPIFPLNLNLGTPA